MPITKRYDPLFEKYGRNIPIPYLRSLAKWESSMRPTLAEPRSGWGLLQVVRVVLKDYNDAHPNATVKRKELLEPEPNVKVACWLLNIIYKSWNKTSYLRVDWKNPNRVELFTAGWNSGWSISGGLPAVARAIVKDGKQVTMETVTEYAPKIRPRFARNLKGNKTTKWVRLVRRDYFKELQAEPETPKEPEKTDDRERTVAVIGLLEEALAGLETIRDDVKAALGHLQE